MIGMQLTDQYSGWQPCMLLSMHYPSCPPSILHLITYTHSKQVRVLDSQASQHGCRLDTYVAPLVS